MVKHGLTKEKAGREQLVLYDCEVFRATSEASNQTD
jgi:hypothetical protein